MVHNENDLNLHVKGTDKIVTNKNKIKKISLKGKKGVHCDSIKILLIFKSKQRYV